MKMLNKGMGCNMQLTLDFETKDYRLNEGKGVGWCFNELAVLCAGVKVNDEPTYIVDIKKDGIEELEKLVKKSTSIVAHNIQYELGCLEFLGIDYIGKTLYDTQLGAKLLNNTRFKYDLDTLAKDYLGDCKTNTDLEDLLPKTNLKIQSNTNLTKTAKENMDLLYDIDKDVVFKYCVQDVDLTYELHNLLIESVDVNLYQKYSKVAEVCVKMQKRGVQFDIEKAKEVKKKLQKELDKSKQDLIDITGEFNINSPKQKIEVFEQLGLKVALKKRANGTFSKSCDEKWLTTQHHPACKLLVRVMKLDKLISMFIDKAISFTDDKGILHPSMSVLRAVTGRFSSSMPNIQQIPKRNKEFAGMIRGLFIPFEGDEWFHMDFSAQEPRLLSHYAILYDKVMESNSIAVKNLRESYEDDADMDFHQFAVDAINKGSNLSIEREESKHVTLGILYGMGDALLATTLGVSLTVCRQIKSAYYKAMPFIKVMDKALKDRWKTVGTIKTLGGRTCQKESGHVALNRLIQGSAADMVMDVMLVMYEHDIIPLCVVHDEINISTNNRKVAETVQEIMTTTSDLCVPLVAEIKSGKSWGDVN